VPDFSGLPRAILLSISALSGEAYRDDVEEEELRAELSKRGFEPKKSTLDNVMHQLQDAGYLSCTFTGGGIVLIQLEQRGRQEVEGWPVLPGQPTTGDVQALLDTFLARSEDPEVPEQERGKARAAAGALKDLGVNVTGQVVVAWLRQIGALG
jgi:DNA-binding PadR family transcriptional regulator